MKPALTLLSLFLIAACASNDGFVDDNRTCQSGDEVGIEAGFDMQNTGMESGSHRLTMLVRVSNNSHQEITVKRVSVDPMTMDRDSPYELERGSREVNQVIAEGAESTFEIPMFGRRRPDSRYGTIRTNSGVDLSVSVWLEPDQTYRCRFQLPVAF